MDKTLVERLRYWIECYRTYTGHQALVRDIEEAADALEAAYVERGKEEKCARSQPVAAQTSLANAGAERSGAATEPGWIETGSAPVCAACGVSIGEYHKSNCAVLWGGVAKAEGRS